MIDLGCVFPHRLLARHPDKLGHYFETIEDLGFDYVSVIDHVAGAPRESLEHLPLAPYTHKDPFLEALVVLAYAAACTTRLELATGILVLPQRQVVLAAKQLATVDAVSGGRLRVGLGV